MSTGLLVFTLKISFMKWRDLSGMVFIKRILGQGSANCFVKGQIVRFSGFGGPCSNYPLCFCRTEAATDNIETNVHGCVPTRL